MTGTFKANIPTNNFLLFVYGFALKLPLFIFPKAPLLQPSDGILYRSFVNGMLSLFHQFPFVFGIISFALLGMQAVSFNKIVNDQRMLQKPNYLTGMSYLLITSLFADWFALSSALITNTLIIWIWSKLCTLHNSQSPKTTIFNVGLIIGLASFIYLPAILFSLLFVVGIAITRPFKLNEWLIGLVGITIPFYFFAAWLFLTENYKPFHLPTVALSLPVFFQNRWGIIAIIVVLSAMLFGIFFIQNNLRRQIVQTRKSWQLLFLYLLVAAFIPFVNATNSFNSWIIVAVPASLLVGAAFFYPDKKWFPLLMHWGMVGIAVAIAYFVR